MKKPIAIVMMSLVSGGCAMFGSGSDEDPVSVTPPPRPTTVPVVENDVSTPVGLFREIFIDFPRRMSEIGSGKSTFDSAQRMEDSMADNRRDGISDMVGRSFGKQAPYTDRYAQLAAFDGDPLVRATAMRALNRSRSAEAGKVFADGLSDDSPLVRLEAAKALSNVPSEQAIQALIKVANTTGEESDIRIAAADALRHYRNLEVARTLINLLDDRDFAIGWQARQSLRYMTGGDMRYNQTAWLNFVTGPQKPLG